MSGIFEASPEGFRALNMARPPSHLVRELVQNVLDEAATICRVTVKHTPAAGVYISVEDDVPGGIRDSKLVFTLWLTDKQDAPTKRGRMGRGLKELVSVSDWTLVRTTGRDAIEFRRKAGGEWTRSSRGVLEKLAVGSVVETEVKGWKAKDANEIIAYLKRVRPPPGIELTVNGEQVRRRPPSETYRLDLPSVVFIFDEGERKESNRQFSTAVELFAEETPHVYEMGLPIEPIDYPLSIDVGQRVPLREKRDTLLSWYRSELYAKLLNERIQHAPPEQLKDNYILKACEASAYLDDATKLKLSEAWTGGLPFASSPLQHSIATGQHVPVVNLRGLPEAIRDIVKEVGVDVKSVLAARLPELCPTATNLAPAERRLADVWQWLAAKVGRPCDVEIRDGHPGAVASFNPATHQLAIYRQEIVAWASWTRNPLTQRPLATLIHELSHWKQLEESHGLDFHSDVEEVGGAIAAFLVAHADEALTMVQA